MTTSPLIVDAHVYSFEAPDAAAGFASSGEHLDVWQMSYALADLPAWRVRDRAAADARLLLDPRPGDPLRLARDRAFRVDRERGRLVWTVDGEDVTKHVLPPTVLEYPAGHLIGAMDDAGVDWALLHVDKSVGDSVAYQAACVRAYPDRLRSMAPVDEPRIEREPDAVIRAADDAIRIHGLHALKVTPAYAYRHAGARGFDGQGWRPFWDAVTNFGVPIFLTLDATPGFADERAGFAAELATLRALEARYPSTQFSVTHGFPWRLYLDGDRFELPDAMWEPFRGSRFGMEVSFPVRIGDRFEYPYRECLPVLEQMLERIGPDRLLWGTDVPFQHRFCTYRQSRTWIEHHARSLDPEDLAAIMGGNAARVLGLPEPSA